MTQLYEEVLDSINAINISVIDAEIDVTKSLIEEYTRHISIVNSIESEGIILEGDWFTKEREEGENIFKTIFLFIPRLIINLIDKIKLLWQKYKDKKEGKDMEKIEVSQETIDSETKKMIVERTGDPRIVIINNSYGVLTKLYCESGYFKKATELYMLFDKRFAEYADLLGTTNIGDAMEKSIVDRITIENNQIFADEPIFPLTVSDYLEYKKILLGAIAKASEDVRNVMKCAIRDYEMRIKELSPNDVSARDKSIAEEFVKVIEKTYTDFQRFDMDVRNELELVKRSFDRIAAEIYKDEAKGEEE